MRKGSSDAVSRDNVLLVSKRFRRWRKEQLRLSLVTGEGALAEI